MRVKFFFDNVLIEVELKAKEKSNKPRHIEGFYYDHEKNRYFPTKNNHTQPFDKYTKTIKNNIQRSHFHLEKSKLNFICRKKYKIIGYIKDK